MGLIGAALTAGAGAAGGRTKAIWPGLQDLLPSHAEAELSSLQPPGCPCARGAGGLRCQVSRSSAHPHHQPCKRCRCQGRG